MNCNSQNKCKLNMESKEWNIVSRFLRKSRNYCFSSAIVSLDIEPSENWTNKNFYNESTTESFITNTAEVQTPTNRQFDKTSSAYLLQSKKIIVYFTLMLFVEYFI